MVQLPNEILEEILCRLFVKCLFRFRCSKPRETLGIQRKNNDLFREDFDSLHDNVLQRVLFSSITLTIQNYGRVPKCSCDGLICMANPGRIQRIGFWNPSTIRHYGPAPCFGDCLICMPKIRAIDYVFLWNPSTRKSIQLPYASIEIANQFERKFNVNVNCEYRIGYDSINDDYKVLRIVILISTNSGILDYEVKVYSLKLNSWHRLEKFPHCPNWEDLDYPIVGGAFHFMSIVKSDLKSESLIVAFDLGTEKCRVLPQPEYRGPHLNICLNNFEGCLSLSCNYESSIVDVFLLKEYGRKNEHWSRLITLSPTFHLNHYLTPIAYSNSGKKVWLDMGFINKFVSYNLEQKSVEEIGVYDTRLTNLLYTCLESLVDVPAASNDLRKLGHGYVGFFKIIVILVWFPSSKSFPPPSWRFSRGFGLLSMSQSPGRSVEGR
ncbi:F-box protein CPR1-like [Impatiens glandulifera]|uniref:F-box protein CPR1-like n=1 Tax=Impatiens glandulifera TaxID=253017 RepID=UPI001FB1036D|nr:F-box protein CPR1-like [Impatiens glandulifera]